MPGAHSIVGLGALSAQGSSVPEHEQAALEGRDVFRRLGGLLGEESPHRDLQAAWIEPRKKLIHRKWSPLTMAALDVARQAIVQAGWSADELRECVIFFGTSRGPAAGWIDVWPERRAFPLMAASNSLHSEPAAAISIELGIQGGWQVQASACAAGLDALGLAGLWLSAGMAPRALVVAVDLPLSPSLLDSYAATGILSSTGKNDPYSADAAGLLPAEAAAAVALEAGPSEDKVLLHGYLTNADAAAPLSQAEGTPMLRKLLQTASEKYGRPSCVCPHASGTRMQAMTEPDAIQAILGQVPLCPLKPLLGHGIAGGGLLETVLLASFLQKHLTPPVMAGLTCPDGLTFSPPLPQKSLAVWKIASALGGKNSLIALSSPHE
jgi:3-oxoacyl-[acyl-carrier-protein] synthase II